LNDEIHPVPFDEALAHNQGQGCFPVGHQGLQDLHSHGLTILTHNLAAILLPGSVKKVNRIAHGKAENPLYVSGFSAPYDNISSVDDRG
jgi:hypothetical protein